MNQGGKCIKVENVVKIENTHQSRETLNQGEKCHLSSIEIENEGPNMIPNEYQRWYNCNIVPSHLNPNPNMY